MDVVGTATESQPMTRGLIVGTRPSQLARRQTELVVYALRSAWPELQADVKVYTTRGDRQLDRPLPEIGGKGLFTAEIERALHQREIDVAVHSLKDLPIADSDGLIIGAVPEREAAHDVLVSRHQLPLEALPASPCIGTSSPRRCAQIMAARPDARVVTLRGNVDARLRKAASAEYDAVVLAAAGIIRMGLEWQVTQHIPFQVMLPAPGQGALAIQCRADDESTLALLRPLHHATTWAAVTAERAFLSGLGGGCSAPVAAYAEPDGSGSRCEPSLRLQGLVASLDGQQMVRVAAEGSSEESEQLGFRLAAEALARGARALLR